MSLVKKTFLAFLKKTLTEEKLPFVNLNPGLRIHYLDENAAGNTVVLLLHGLGATGESWLLQFPALIQKNYHVIAPDARGFGKSTYPGGRTSISQMAGDMVGLLKNLGVSQAHVVGISLGGTLALQMALDYPDLVNRLVLVNTFAVLRPDRISVWFYYAQRFILINLIGLPTQARAVARHIFPDPQQEEYRRLLVEQILQADPHGYRSTMIALAFFNVKRYLSKIQAPTLIVTGEKDNTVPPKNQAHLVELIPGARQIMIPSAGHAVTIDQPDAFNRCLIDFFNGM